MQEIGTIDKIKNSFSVQAENFETDKMNFTKKEYLDYTVRLMKLASSDRVLEVAAGTCACGRSVSPFVKEVVCLDATQAMLDIGKREAEKAGIKNMSFVSGLAEKIPYESETFDVVMSRLAFHHFEEIEKPFSEMVRVLKKGGKLVLIDMEAASEELREKEDMLETLRDFSHVKNRSASEFEKLYADNRIKITEKQATKIEVSLDAWLELTKTPQRERDIIISAMENEIAGGEKTGFVPFIKEEKMYFLQRWIIFIGIKD